MSKAKRLYKKRQKFPPQWANTYSSTVNIGLITHPVFLSLSPAAKLICIVTQIENQRAAHNKHKEKEIPFFEWTAFDSETNLQISRRHHFNAVKELKEKGFLKVLQPGGLLGCNGTGNVYALSAAWKRYQVPEKTTSPTTAAKLAKARQQIGRKRSQPENEIAQVMDANPQIDEAKPENTVAQVKQRAKLESFKNLPPFLSWEEPRSGQRAYIKRECDVRSVQIKLLEPVNNGAAWVIKPNRQATKLNPVPAVMPLSEIVPVDHVQPDKFGQNEPEKNRVQKNGSALHQ